MIKVGETWLRAAEVNRVRPETDGRDNTVRIVTYTGTDVIEYAADWQEAQTRAAEIARLVARSEAPRPASARVSLPERLAARQAQPSRVVQRSSTVQRQPLSAFAPTHFRDSAARMARTASEAQRGAAAYIGGSMLAGME
jgi:hypothetical protein